MIVDVGLHSKLLHQGCFETMLGLNGKIPLIQHHFSRLQRGLDLLNWQRPSDLTMESVENWYRQEVDATDTNHWRIRLSVELIQDKLQWSVSIEETPHPTKPFTLKSIRLTDHHNSVHEQLCKLSDRVIYKSAMKLAQLDEADDALLISKEGLVSETCIAGVLLLKNGRLFTPDVSSGGIRGVGLEFLKPLLISNLISIKERPLELESVLNADSVWLVNALRGPFPVKSIDGKSVSFNSEWHKQISDLYWSRIQELISEELY